MKEIILKGGEVCLVDDGDFDKMSGFKWFCDSSGYAHNNTKGKHIRMHRFLMDSPQSMVVDHIDGNTLNNQRKNLRVCTHLQNIKNHKKNSKNTSGYNGVNLMHGKYWRAYISGKHIGLFKNKEDAAKAYDKAAKEIFGEFANLNFKSTNGGKNEDDKSHCQIG
jgi:hypothetical protein